MENVFLYQWHFEEIENVTVIRIFGLNEKNQSIYIQVSDFTPYIYLELPDNIVWNQSKAQMVCNYFDNNLQNPPLKKQLVKKKRLYYAHKVKDVNGNYVDKLFPYLFMSFATQSDIKKFSFLIRKSINIPGLGAIKFKIHESDANPILQLVCVRDIPTAGWVKIKGNKIKKEEQESYCDFEYNISFKNIEKLEKDTPPRPLLMGMDIEVNSSNPNTMPNANKPNDKVFQISCVFARQGDSEDKYEKYILSLGQPDQETTGNEIKIISCKTEGELLEAYSQLLRDKNPQIIIGYNIFMFDIPYMMDRAKYNYSFKFNQQTCIAGKQGKEKLIKWSSSAYGNQEFKFLDCEGRLFVDLLPLIKRDYKFDTYSLKAVSTNFIGQTKDPLTHKGIFKCYRLGTPKALGVCAKYCFTGDTKVMLRYRSESIENLKNNENNILSFSEEKNGLIYSKQNKFFNNGIQDCLEIELIDGTKINCTKDHKIMLCDNTWKEAGKLKTNEFVKCGITFPYINLEEEFKICSGFDFTLFQIKEIKDMEKGFAFARLLGYILTDGSISGDRGYLYIGCKMDLEDIFYDIKIITGVQVNTYINGNTYRLELPKNLMEVILNLENIRKGARINQDSLIPSIIYKFPLPFLREFIGGLMGGDGHTVSFNKKSNKLNSIAFSQTIKTEKIESLINTFKDYQILFQKFNIITLLGNPKKPGGSKEDCSSLELRISTKSLIDFENLIGFRYCYHKSYRLKIGTSFYKIRSEKIKLYDSILSKIKERVNQGFSIYNSYNYIKEQEFKDVSIPIRETFNSRYDSNFENYVFRDKNTLEGNCKKFLIETGSYNFICSQDVNKKSYSLAKNAESIPTFNLPIKSIKEVGKKQVFDIEVNNTHNFLANGIVVHNCTQDSNLVVKLFEKLQTWYGLCEMAKTCNIPIFYTYTQGQQIKVFSQIYKKCYQDNYVVEKDGYVAKENDRYTGAYVFDPVPGLYDMIVSFDFSSLYPTTIIAYNIDYTTLVLDESIPDEKCNIFQWSDHIGCPCDKTVRKTKIKKEDVMCAERYFRFLKEPKGVLPTLLENLLGARKTTNKQIAGLEEKLKTEELDDKEKIEIKSLISVLDKRQLAYKVSANSMYGAMGVKRGYLPFLPGAMCTTARGRQSIEKAAKHLKEVHQAKLVYGDTDSTYIHFDNIPKAKDLWNHALAVEDEVSSLFPRPMKLAFEEKIYWRYFILSKKRYMALKCDLEDKVIRYKNKETGELEDDIFKRGVLLARRDNSKFVQKLYKDLIMKIFYREDKDKVLNLVVQRVNELFYFTFTCKDFVITKSIGDLDDYKIRPLPDDEKKRQKRLLDLECTESEYRLKALPAHIQLSERMKRRGRRVDTGTRLEYVVTTNGGWDGKLFDKIEDLEYFKEHSDLLRLDFLYYLKNAINPIDEAIKVAYGINDFLDSQYKLRVLKHRTCKKIENKGYAKITLLD
jgi:DNA polymerase elongation subunit (family B)